MAAHLAQIERVNPSVNAIVTLLPERAMAGAKAADEALAQGEDVAVGHVVLAGVRCPVYALDAGLQMVLVPPPQRRVCIVVPGPDGPLGFLADAVARAALEMTPSVDLGNLETGIDRCVHDRGGTGKRTFATQHTTHQDVPLGKAQHHARDLLHHGRLSDR